MALAARSAKAAASIRSGRFNAGPGRSGTASSKPAVPGTRRRASVPAWARASATPAGASRRSATQGSGRSPRLRRSEMNSPPRVFMTAAELSAERHLANLARAVLAMRPDVELEGVGGSAMREAGVTVHHETVRRARFGLGAFLRAGEVIRMLRWTRQHFREAGPPDVMVCCDSWTMNKHFLRIARELGVKTLYYVSPQVWASREGRVAKIGSASCRERGGSSGIA